MTGELAAFVLEIRIILLELASGFVWVVGSRRGNDLGDGYCSDTGLWGCCAGQLGLGLGGLGSWVLGAEFWLLKN